MALQDYANLTVIYNGIELKQFTSVKRELNGGWIVVNTIADGLAGFSKGAGEVTIEITLAVPLSGLEAEFESHCVEGNYATIQLGCANKDYAGNGMVMSSSLSQDVQKATEFTFKWTGELKPME